MSSSCNERLLSYRHGDCYVDLAGREMRVSSATKSSDTLVSIPWTACISSSAAVADASVIAIAAALQTHGIVPSPGLLIVLKLACERAKGPTSEWHAYISFLPSGVPSLLHARTQCMRTCAGLLAHTAFQERAWALRQVNDSRIQRLLSVLGDLAPSWLTYGNVHWAHAMYTSRAMSIPCPPVGLDLTGRWIPALVPLLDQADHTAIGARARWCLHDKRTGASMSLPPSHARVADADPLLCLDPMSTIFITAHVPDFRSMGRYCVGLESTAALARGSPITINYGTLTNTSLVYRYGFALSFHPADSLLVAINDEKKLVLCDEQSERTYHLSSVDLSTSLLTAIAREVCNLSPSSAALPSQCMVGGDVYDLLAPSGVTELQAEYGDGARPVLSWLAQRCREIAAGLSLDVQASTCSSKPRTGQASFHAGDSAYEQAAPMPSSSSSEEELCCCAELTKVLLTYRQSVVRVLEDTAAMCGSG